MVTLLQAGPYLVEVTRKNIRRLYLRLGTGPDRLRVSAPFQAGDREIQQFVFSKEAWIKKALAARPGMEPGRLPLWGEQYPVQAEAAPGTKGGICYTGEAFRLALPAPEMEAYRRTGEIPPKRLAELYRAALREEIPRLWGKALAQMGEGQVELRLKIMKTRWGVCNPAARRVWLNPLLARYPKECLYYVMIHELCHLREPRHDQAFYACLDRALPGWREARGRLRQPW